MTTYHSPQLELVGAAQDLVLDTCPIDKANEPSSLQVILYPQVSCDEDFKPDQNVDLVAF